MVDRTVTGVILLHLLWVPGMSFFIEGSRVFSQELDQDITELNQTLLTMGVLSFLIPTAFFNALDGREAAESPVTEEVRHQILNISRGMAIMLICVYSVSFSIISDWCTEQDMHSRNPSVSSQPPTPR